MSGRKKIAGRRRVGGVFILVGMLLGVLAVTTTPSGASHQDAPAPTIEGPDTEKLGRCTGVDRGDPGEDNTKKVLIGGDLVPGGTAMYRLSFPAEEAEATSSFRVLDCMYAGTEAFAKYEISNIAKHIDPATEIATFEFDLTVTLPDIPVGTVICNVAQTIGQSTGSQGSNRKTGAECFILGGSLVVRKVITGTDTPLPGAVFSVDCDSLDPNRPVVISPEPDDDDLVTTPATGIISIAGPEGSPCLIHEVSAPSGYVVDDAAVRTVTIPRSTGGAEVMITFGNSPDIGTLVISKVSDTPGTFSFEVVCGEADPQTVTITVANTGVPGTTSAPISDIPSGTSCTVTEITPAGFTAQAAQTIVIAFGTNAVSFTNVHETGSLDITKVSDTPGAFSFTVDCPGTSVTDQPLTITVPTAGGPGTTSTAITTIPTGTVCTVTETTAAGFTPQAPQTITIGLGANTVTFTNVRQTGTLVITKTTVGGTGTFGFTVDCNPGTAFDQTLSLTNNETRRISGIPTGTSCVVTEAASATFTSAVTPADGTVVIATGDNTVSFTNTVIPPAIVPPVVVPPVVVPPVVVPSAVVPPVLVPAAVLGEVIERPAAAVPPKPAVLAETLPRTGSNGMAMAMLGSMFIALGMVFRGWGGRRPVRAEATSARRR